MAQTTSGNYDALVWVQEDIQQSLETALQTVTQFIETPDRELITPTLEQLVNSHGVLEMLALDGASMLLKEIISSFSLLNKQTENSDAVTDSLLKSLLLLPNYLKLIGHDFQDHPLRLIEIINEVRTARGDDALIAANLLDVDFSAPLPESVVTPSTQAIATGLTLEKASHAFQLTLLQWIKTQNPENLHKIRQILHFLHKNATHERLTLLWWVAEGFVEAIVDSGLAIDSEVKLTLGNFNKPIKLASQGGQLLLEDYPTNLIKNTLLLISRSSSEGPQVSLLKQFFGLNFSNEQQHQQIYSFGDNALSEVHIALLEQLQEAKERIGQFSPDQDSSNSILLVLIDSFSNISNTLDLLNEPDAAAILRQQEQALNHLVSENSLPSEEQLLSLANDVLKVEGMIRGAAGSEQNDDSALLQRTVIIECLNELISIKEALIQLDNNVDSDDNTLADTAMQLELIAGSLTMLNLNDASQVLETASAQMRDTQTLTPELLANYAEVLAAIELYMQAFSDHGLKQGQLLAHAQANLAGQTVAASTSEISHDLDLSEPLELDLPEPITTELTVEEETSYQEQSVADSEPLTVELETENLELTDSGITDEDTEVSIDVAVTATPKVTSVQRYLNLLNTKSTSVQRYIDGNTLPAQSLEVTSDFDLELTDSAFELPAEESLEITALDNELELEPTDTSTEITKDVVPSVTSVQRYLNLLNTKSTSVQRYIDGDMLPVEPLDEASDFDLELADSALELPAEESLEITDLDDELELEPTDTSTESTPHVVPSVTSVQRYLNLLNTKSTSVQRYIDGDMLPIEPLDEASDFDLELTDQSFELPAEESLELSALDDQLALEPTNTSTESTPHVVPKVTSVQRYLNLLNTKSTSVQQYIDGELVPTSDTQDILETSSLQEELISISNTLDLEPHLSDYDIAEPELADENSGFAEGIDSEIAEIFIEEANEVLEELAQLIPHWQQQQDLDSLSTIRRHYHTLKGSGRMAGATVIGELAWSVESLLNHILDQNGTVSPAVEQLVTNSYNTIPDLLNRFVHGDMESTPDVDALSSEAQRLLNPETETETETENILSEREQLLAIFHYEAAQHLTLLKNSLASLRVPFAISEQQLKATHSLKGCANIAQVMPVAAVATELDACLKALYKQLIELDQDQASLLETIVIGLSDLTEQQLDASYSAPEQDDLLTLVHQLKPSDTNVERAIDPEVLVAYLEETDELLEQYSQQLQQYKQQTDNSNYQADITTTLNTLADSSSNAQLHVLADLYGELGNIISVTTASNSQQSFNLLEQGYEQLNTQIEAVVQNQELPDISEFKQKVMTYLSDNDSVIEETLDTTQSDRFIIPSDDIELLEAFTEECQELLESSGEAIKRWRQDVSDNAASMQLQRDLHTIKGGARLTGITPIADLTHHTESLVLSAYESQNTNNEFFALLQRCQDRLSEMHESMAQNADLAFAYDLHNAIAEMMGQTPVDVLTNVIANVVETPAPSSVETSSPTPPATESQPAHVEQVRVRADLLDFLTNFAGEVNISRDRVSQHNSAIKQQLSEMEATIERLQDQLRNLEIETETQILFRYDGETLNKQSEFDPLELDRFSMIQQLSRGLTESVSDLNDITGSLNGLVRESDSILLEQARLSTDIQQGLMNTRLLPFDGLVPRLERIVRQTNDTVGKASELTVHGAEREIDRSILDHIIAPIEHILRNAIGHGIETPQQRIASGKPETGSLTLSITRDGSEVLITIADDGQGIDVEKIRQKALGLNLINQQNMPSDDELIQLILSSGFSTADDVSQLSGRGVGMDVVSNEIRALKGRLSIQSIKGQGTTFSIRLPMTLSILQALMVSSADQQYAIPLAAVHAGERISVGAIKQLLAEEGEPRYDFNGTYYQFTTLAKLLGHNVNLPEDDNRQLPLLLFHYGDKHIALLVDAINSNREIVLKSIGPQLGQIEAINGATILGDGQVAFVLDIPTLIDDSQTSSVIEQHVELTSALDLEQEQTHTPIAMVVDDSITMRKASSNLLKRHGFEVITARDGIDAVALLNEQTPDIILLDVEMPRMDGFEFATLIRNDPDTQSLPIIMITSRTGDKHRQRASTIGVNAYLGKPYQELEIVKTLQSLLGDAYPSSQ